MNKLKPCPFCGGKAELKQDIRYPRSGKYKGEAVTAYEAVCTNSDCIIYNADNKYFFTREAATQAWNKRSTGWISVKDRLPELFVEVLAAYKNSCGEWSYTVSERFHFNGKTEIKWAAMAGQTPDYWMPLPELQEVNDNATV